MLPFPVNFSLTRFQLGLQIITFFLHYHYRYYPFQTTLFDALPFHTTHFFALSFQVMFNALLFLHQKLLDVVIFLQQRLFDVLLLYTTLFCVLIKSCLVRLLFKPPFKLVLLILLFAITNTKLRS